MGRVLLLTLTALLAATSAQAKAPALKWMDGPPGLPSGSKFAVVSGDPGKAGNFVIRAKGSRHSPVAPNGCTMLVFFLKPTVGLQKALAKGS